MWQQLKTPNLDPVIIKDDGKPLMDWLGSCLWYVRTAFGCAWSGSSALEGWGLAKYKHADRNIPTGVYVPIWFNHYGTYGGVYKNWGHVAIYKDGKIWSSPLTHKPTADVFTSIATVESKFKATYIGWSEDLNNVRVAQEVNTMAGISDDVGRQIGWHYLGRNGFDGKPNALNAPQGDITGKELTNAQMSTFFLSAEARDWRDSRIHKVYAERDALKGTNAQLNTQITNMTKQLTDANKVIETQKATIAQLTSTVNEKNAEISGLQDQVVQLTKENTELKAQLATCGNGDDTEWLNKFGEALRWLIERLGLRK